MSIEITIGNIVVLHGFVLQNECLPKTVPVVPSFNQKVCCNIPDHINQCWDDHSNFEKNLMKMNRLVCNCRS